MNCIGFVWVDVLGKQESEVVMGVIMAILSVWILIQRSFVLSRPRL